VLKCSSVEVLKGSEVKQVVDKKVKMSLVGLDGNAFSIMGAFQKEAKKQDWTSDEINLVLGESRSGTYDHLLATIMIHTEEPEKREEEDDWDDDEEFSEYEMDEDD